MEILQDAMFEALMPISIGLAGIVTGIKAGSCCRDFFPSPVAFSSWCWAFGCQAPI
jgi:hypothetical protein